MTTAMDKIQAAIAEAAAQTNMNETTSGGGDGPRLPDAGNTRLRFISYIETGLYDDEFKGDIKRKNGVTLQFELSGPKHPPLELEGGRKVPFIITINENLSSHEKGNFPKLFKRMNHTGEFTHMAQMLGQEFAGTVVLVTKGEGAEKRTYANLRDDQGYTIRPAYTEDAETGESVKLNVAPALTPIKCFIYAYADKEQWDSIFIDGRWDDRKDSTGKVTQEGGSKNVYQERIKASLNFAGSPMADLLFASVDGDAEAPPFEAETPARKAAPADPLEAVG